MEDWRSGLGYRIPDLAPPVPVPRPAVRLGEPNAIRPNPGYHVNYPDWLQNSQSSVPIPNPDTSPHFVHPQQHHYYYDPDPRYNNNVPQNAYPQYPPHYYPYPHPQPQQQPLPNPYQHQHVPHPQPQQQPLSNPYQHQHVPHPQPQQQPLSNPYQHQHVPHPQPQQQPLPNPYQHQHIPRPQTSPNDPRRNPVNPTANQPNHFAKRENSGGFPKNGPDSDSYTEANDLPIPGDTKLLEADDDGFMSDIEEIDYSNGSVNVSAPLSDVLACEEQQLQEKDPVPESRSKGTRTPMSVDVPQSTIPLRELFPVSPQKSSGSSVSGNSSKETNTAQKTGTKRKRSSYEDSNGTDDLAEFLGRTNRRVASSFYAKRKEKAGDGDSTSSLSPLKDLKDTRGETASVSVPATAVPVDIARDGIITGDVPKIGLFEGTGLPGSLSSEKGKLEHRGASPEDVTNQVVQHACANENTLENTVFGKDKDTEISCMEECGSSVMDTADISDIPPSATADFNPSAIISSNESVAYLDIRIRTDIFEDSDNTDN